MERSAPAHGYRISADLGAVSNATVTILKTVVGNQVMTQLVTTWNKLAVGF